MHTSSRPIGILMAGRLSVSQIPPGRSRYYLAGQVANQGYPSMYGVKPRGTGFRLQVSITVQAMSDGLQLLRAINATQAHGQEGARVDPRRAAHEAGLDVGDVGSDRYHNALGYLLEEAALLGDEHTAFDVGEKHPHGYALYFFTRRAVKLLEG
jgi:hypothetical protein